MGGSMAFITWNDALSVHIAEIDAQHKCLIDLINQLHDSMKAGKGNAVIGSVLLDLIKYTQFHFATEEKYFQKYAYPEYFLHKKQHDDLTRKTNELNAAYAQGKLTISLETMSFLKNWVSTHILESDQKYSPFLCNRGLS
jgi:hemerythrin